MPNAYRDGRFDPTWDRKSGYKTRSILCVPVLDSDADAGDKFKCIGCLQLINKKDKFERTDKGEFDRKDEEFAQNFCVVVATAIKAAKLKKSKAAIKALADEAAITVG